MKAKHLKEKHAYGDTFRDAREAKGLTQDDVADHLHVTKGMVSHYETGNCLPPFNKLVRLCALLDIELKDLAKAA